MTYVSFDDKSIVEGFSLIKNKFNEVLKSQGLTQIEVKKGYDFDSEIHEAITQIPAESNKMKGKIVVTSACNVA